MMWHKSEVSVRRLHQKQSDREDGGFVDLLIAESQYMVYVLFYLCAHKVLYVNMYPIDSGFNR